MQLFVFLNACSSPEYCHQLQKASPILQADLFSCKHRREGFHLISKARGCPLQESRTPYWVVHSAPVYVSQTKSDIINSGRYLAVSQHDANRSGDITEYMRQGNPPDLWRGTAHSTAQVRYVRSGTTHAHSLAWFCSALCAALGRTNLFNYFKTVLKLCFSFSKKISVVRNFLKLS